MHADIPHHSFVIFTNCALLAALQRSSALVKCTETAWHQNPWMLPKRVSPNARCISCQQQSGPCTEQSPNHRSSPRRAAFSNSPACFLLPAAGGGLGNAPGTRTPLPAAGCSGTLEARSRKLDEGFIGSSDGASAVAWGRGDVGSRPLLPAPCQSAAAVAAFMPACATPGSVAVRHGVMLTGPWRAAAMLSCVAGLQMLSATAANAIGAACGAVRRVASRQQLLAGRTSGKAPIASPPLPAQGAALRC